MKGEEIMKKSNLVTGIAYVAFGFACLIAALCLETKLEGILWGFAGAGIVPGIGMIVQYFYWSEPKNRERYLERLERLECVQIESNDELNVKVRNLAGRYAYVSGLMIVCASILFFGILGALEIIENARLIILYLSAYLLIEIAVYIAVFHRLMKKY